MKIIQNFHIILKKIIFISLLNYQVVEILKNDMFLKYDIAVITTFLTHIMDEMIGNDVRLSNGMTGEVIMNNSGAIGRPVVKCKEGVVDLMQQRDVKIIELI